MPDRPSRFTWVVKLARFWAILTLALIGLAIAVTIARGITSLRQGVEVEPLLWWILALVGEAAAAVLVALLYGLVETVVANERAVEAGLDRAKRLESVAEAVLESTRRLVDLSQMSDAGKSLVFRDREIEALNELIHEYVIRQDETKAEALVAQVEKRLGYADQVERMRSELAAARETTIDQKVDAAIQRINQFIEKQDWAQAMRHTRRLLAALPDNPKVAALPQLVRSARIKHKRGLLQDYGEAVKTGDIDRSIELIRELDKYLTPQEGAALQESARGVFRAKLHNLGVQFAIRVTEENWDEAISIGEQIINEYPNSRMAQEVRTKMETLRTLAAAKQDAPS